MREINLEKHYRQKETWLIAPSRGGRLQVGLVYPSTYYVGMSSLGYQVIYRLLAEQPEVQVERLFFQKPGYIPRSIESERPADEFDILAFSCSFEPDYINLIRFLLQSRIEPLAAKRPENAPLLLAGGIAVTANPAPLSTILDAILLGDGEEIVQEVFNKLANRNFHQASREDILRLLAEVEGVYVPAVHGIPGVRQFSRRQLKSLNDYPTGSAILTPETDLSEMFLVEVARGCVRGCSFCLTGHFNQRLRLRSIDNLTSQIAELRLKLKKVGLIAAEIACHPGIPQLCEYLVEQNLEISTSSLEIDRLSRPLLDLLVRGGQKTLTIAPESGDEALRFGLHKRIPDEKIFELAAMSAEAGVERLKMYVIIGMPHSHEEEVAQLIRFLEKIKAVFFAPAGRRHKELVVSVNPFIPKPHTPWELEAMLPEKELKRRLQEIRQSAGKIGGIRLTSLSPTAAALDAMISSGNTTTGIILLESARQGDSVGSIARNLAEKGPVDPFTTRPKSVSLSWRMVKTE